MTSTGSVLRFLPLCFWGSFGRFCVSVAFGVATLHYVSLQIKHNALVLKCLFFTVIISFFVWVVLNKTREVTRKRCVT